MAQDRQWEVKPGGKSTTALYYLLPVGMLVIAGLVALVNLSGQTDAIPKQLKEMLPLILFGALVVVGFVVYRVVAGQRKKAHAAAGQVVALREGKLRIGNSGRPVPLSRADVAVCRAYLTGDVPYGTVCSISERGMPQAWRILSDTELTVEQYNSEATRDLTYDFYMAPDVFRDLVDFLDAPSGGDAMALDGVATERPPGRQVFEATKHRGAAFVLGLVGLMFALLIGLCLLGWALTRFLPEYEEALLMGVVALLPILSIVVFLVGWKRGGKGRYHLELSPGKLALDRQDRPERIEVDFESALVQRFNWVSSGQHGRFRLGPVLEFQNDSGRKVRIAARDPKLMWEKGVKEIGSPHFEISRDAWNALISSMGNEPDRTA